MADLSLLKILFYVDSDWFRFPDAEHKFTTERLQEALHGGAEPVDVVLGGPHRRVPLADQLADRHEVWFFLVSEDLTTALTPADIDALKAWMDAGNGVLITGDHAVGVGEQMHGLGAPVGKGVPRARHMRVWDDPPDTENYVANSIDNVGADAKVAPSEFDAVPQRLLLPALRRNAPHAIFVGKGKRILNKFPDHAHEGEVRAIVSYPERPDNSFPDIPYEWPYFPPKIEVVAYSVNWRSGRTHPLMALWDQGAGPKPPGRIIADSSFHHYVDENLDGIARAEAEVAREDWSKIQELFRSFAFWLAPKQIRDQYLKSRQEAALQREETVALVGRQIEEIGGEVIRVLADTLPGVLYHQLLDELADEYELSTAAREAGPELITSLLGAKVQSQLQGQGAADVVERAMRRFLEIKKLPEDALRELRGTPTLATPSHPAGYRR